MKKIFTTLVAVIATAVMANAQTCVLSENFTTFTGSKTALPLGWRGANLSTTASNNFYSTAASSGPSGINAFKFGVTGATLFSPTFTLANGDSILFWVKANALDTTSKLEVFLGVDTITMTLVKVIKKVNIVASGQFFSVPVNASHHFAKFVYTKSAGNLSFDDFCAKSYPVPCALTSNFQTTYDTTGLVHFLSTSTGTTANTTYNWNFGNGNTSSVQNPNYSYTSNGNYNVKLTLKDTSLACTDSTIITITVSSVPTPACTIVANYTFIVDTMGLVHFTNTSTGSVVTYNWSFGDATSSSVVNPSHTYTTNGIYNVKLIITNGCNDTITKTVTVSNIPVAPIQTCFISENFTGYSGSATALPFGWLGAHLNASGNNYTTIASCGPSGLNSFKFQTNTAYLLTPKFNVKAGDSATFWIKGNSIDTLSKLEVFAGADTNSTILVKTINKNNIIASGQFVTIVLNGTEHYLKFAYTKSVGNMAFDDFCIKSDSASTQPCNVQAKFTYALDTMGLVHFTNTSVDTTSNYLWSFGDASANVSTTNPNYQYTTNGTYNATLIVFGGCANDTIIKTITITNIVVAPTCNLVASFTYVIGTNGNVNYMSTSTGVTSATKYTWDFGNFVMGYTNMETATYLSNNTYTVVLTIADSLGTCSNTITQLVTITNVVTTPAQTCFLTENFTSYTGSSAALPTDWTGSGLSTSPTGNVYTSATSAGPSGANSFKFGVNTATLITPLFNALAGDSVTFWIKGNSLDTVSKLEVFVGANTSTMTLLATLNKNNIATSGQFVSFVLNGTEHYLKFAYTKLLGNIAFDDFCIKSDSVISQPVAVKNLNVTTLLNIYPNPNNGEFTLLLNSSNASITIFNVIGEVVYKATHTSTTNTIHLNNVANGTYVVQINTGATIHTQKLFINK
ncbi:MAG: PKD domain-containing protein [Bacteroidia bacterium]|nr:PKD domain-containing protein [Bacteroidia bacterium]